ncbi:hypothetical protein [Actinoplanes sp. NPDC023714]|uniref:hypothetical protein n=1 Tax=Actinoplanes sp. NPDC023714 TaxID=3154322 RepID=UPI0033F33A8D
MRDLLEESVAAEAPGIAWIYMPDEPGEKRTPDGHVTMWQEDPGSIAGRSGITRGGGKGGFYLWLRPVGCGPDGSCSEFTECEGSGLRSCSATRTASGLDLVRYVDKPGRKWVFHGVDVKLPGGNRHLKLLAVNYFGGDGSKPVTDAPLIGQDELVAIATRMADRL